jgi:hypothetical protein
MRLADPTHETVKDRRAHLLDSQRLGPEGRAEWLNEVKIVLAKLRETNPKAKRSDALKIASQARRDIRKKKGWTPAQFRFALLEKYKRVPGWKTPEAHPYGSKNHTPVTLKAAQQILLQYYRDRRAQFKGKPLTAMRRDIANCRDTAHTLTPCTNYTKTQVGTTASGKPKYKVEWFPKECRKSWKYRPGANAKGPTGPGVYDMDGLDNLCKKKGRDGLKQKSALYTMARMNKKPISEEARKKRSDAMKAKWATMSPAKKAAIIAKRKATVAKKKQAAKDK